MPLYCSNTGSTALREAEVQQPMTEAHLSLTRSFFAFSAKVGQSLAPSSWMNLILRPSTPPWALIWSMASFSASTEPVSEIAMVPVTEWRMPTVTSASVTASPVVLIFAVGNCCASASGGSSAAADRRRRPTRSLRRRTGDCEDCPVDRFRRHATPRFTGCLSPGRARRSRSRFSAIVSRMVQCSIRQTTYVPTHFSPSNALS